MRDRDRHFSPKAAQRATSQLYAQESRPAVSFVIRPLYKEQMALVYEIQ